MNMIISWWRWIVGSEVVPNRGKDEQIMENLKEFNPDYSEIQELICKRLQGREKVCKTSFQPAPRTGKISVEKIQRAVDSVSKPKKK